MKMLHATAAALMIEIAALRPDPAENPAAATDYRERIKRGTKIAKPLVRLAIHSYDQMARSLGVRPKKKKDTASRFPNVLQLRER
jgi:hypothetical protein